MAPIDEPSRSASWAASPYAGWIQAPPQKDARPWAVPLAGAIGLLLWLPVIYINVQTQAPGREYLWPAVPLALLLVGLGLVSVRARFVSAKTGQPGAGLRSWLAGASTGRVNWQRLLLIGAIIVVGLPTLGVMAAIIAGPLGVRVAGSGLGILVAGLTLLAAFALARYRPLVPTAAATALASAFIGAQAVADAWGVSHDWNAWALLLVVFFVPVQSMGAEAAFRDIPTKWFWACWTAVGTILAIGWPLWFFFGEQGSDAVPLGMALASLVWGIAANFSLAPIPNGVRWTGVAIFGAWAMIILALFIGGGELLLRLQAAGLVAATAATAVAAVSYWVGAKKRNPQPA